MTSTCPLWMGSKLPGYTAINELRSLPLVICLKPSLSARRRIGSPVKGDPMIADGCNKRTLMGGGSGRRRGRAFRLFHYYPSAGREKFQFTQHREHLRTGVVLERRVNENQIERFVRAAEIGQRPAHFGHEQARAIGQAEIGEICANRRSRIA